MAESFLIALVDRNHGHFYRYDTTGRGLEKLEEVSDIVPKSVKAASWKGLADDKVARHVAAHVRDHFKHIAERIEHYLMHTDTSDHPKAIILGGPEEDLAEFLPLLSHSLQEKVVATIHPDHYSGVKELEKTVTTAVERVAAQQVADVLELINDHRQPGGRGVVGREPVYEALNLKQVQTLLLDPNERYSGFFCPADGSLAESLDRCPSCLGPMSELEDLSEAIRSSARAQSAEIMAVDDADALKPYQALVALKRFG